MLDNMWCINLDHRTDRWEHAQKQFDMMGFTVNRFSAIKHEDGRIGLIKSFLELFKMAKKNKLKYIWIFEDDVLFINNPKENLMKAIEQLPKDWSFFYLGANTHYKLPKISRNLCYLRNGYAAHAVCYRNTLYDVIIDKFEKTTTIKKLDDINDVFFSKLQERYNAYLVNPLIATQIPSYSDLEKRYVNYSFIEERFKINIK